MPRTVYSKLYYANQTTAPNQILFAIPTANTVVIRWVTVELPSGRFDFVMPAFAIRYFNALDLVFFERGRMRPNVLYNFERRVILPGGQNVIADGTQSGYNISISGYELTGLAP